MPPPLVIYTDGSSRGNPGPAGIGVAIYHEEDEENPIEEISKYIGVTTNNVAEYEAIICALKRVHELGTTQATVKIDSELVHQHICGVYKVRSAHLKIQLRRVRDLCRRIEKIDFQLIAREKNRRANKLAQKASKKMVVKKKKISQPPLLGQ